MSFGKHVLPNMFDYTSNLELTTNYLVNLDWLNDTANIITLLGYFNDYKQRSVKQGGYELIT